MWFSVISLFPEMFAALDYGVVGNAKDKGLIDINYFNPRDFSQDKHRNVDDRPFGGGPGMVIQVEPLRAAIKNAKKSAPNSAKVVYLSPTGKRFDHKSACEEAKRGALILIAGRYEGIDQRLIDQDIDEEWSIGDFVVSGGELPAMLVIDSIARQLPGALGHDESAAQDSFADGILDCPHYTRPEVIDGQAVPEVLLSGNHQAISDWRLTQALGQTWLKRPDLLKDRQLTEHEQRLLKTFIEEYQGATDDEHE